MSLVAFIIGAGSNVGSSAASLLKEKGYAVAWGSRNPKVEEIKKNGYFPVQIDITQRSSVVEAFKKINVDLGAPNVVIYNAALYEPPPTPSDPLTLPAETFHSAVSVGANVFTAAQEAIKGFRADNHRNNPKAFIVTGNLLPALKNPPSSYLALDIQKVAEARLVNIFAAAYKEAGFQFAYAHLVSEAGEIPPYDVFLQSGPVHAKVYWELINKKDGEWDYRFTPSGEKLANYESI